VPVAAVVDLVVTDTLGFGEAEVEEEFMGLLGGTCGNSRRARGGRGGIFSVVVSDGML
jgi:hypothetical protein